MRSRICELSGPSQVDRNVEAKRRGKKQSLRSEASLVIWLFSSAKCFFLPLLDFLLCLACRHRRPVSMRSGAYHSSLRLLRRARESSEDKGERDRDRHRRACVTARSRKRGERREAAVSWLPS